MAYDNFYYAHYGASHTPYDRDTPGYMDFFGEMANRIVREIAPATMLDAGCAKGFLVELLRDRGVQAFGVDVSEHAIGAVREDIRPHCWSASLTDPLPQRYDLITCIEVLEHIPLESIDAVVANLCDHTDDILMSSTPDEFADPTHLNVRPPEYWIELFGHHGFYHDVTYDASFIAPWAMRMRRMRDTTPRVFAEYEREVQRLRTEVRERTSVIMQQRDEMAAQAAELEELRKLQLTAEVARLEEALLASQLRADHLQSELDALRRFTDSLAARSAARFQRTLTRLLPPDTRRGHALRSTARAVHNVTTDAPSEAPIRRRLRTPNLAEAYRQWLEEHEPRGEQLTRLRLGALSWADRPTFSIVMPVYNADRKWLDAAVASVREQAYDRWELCIADDASTASHIRPALEAFAAGDPRIKVLFRTENGGIAHASNSALTLASGEFVGFLDHDDVLRPHALATVARALREHPGAGFVYSDEDKLMRDGHRAEFAFKPDWSPDLLLSGNYVSHFSVIRRDLVENVGGFRPGYDGSQDYDLFLRVIDAGCEVHHVAEVLYSWNQVEGSAALSTTAKPHAYEAAVRCLHDSFERRNVAVDHIDPGPSLGWYVPRYHVPSDADVTFVIPTRDGVDRLRRCLLSLAATTKGIRASILLVDNGSTDPATLDFFAANEHRVLRHPGPNFSRLVNEAVRTTQTTCVLLLSDDIEAQHEGWLEAMLEQAMRPEVGAVGARLRLPDGQVEHEGIVIGYRNGLAASVDFGGYLALGDVIRDCSAVTGACMMFRRSVFDEVGGFDERLRVAFNDIDFCLRLQARGYRVIYTPLATLVHERNSSLGRLHPHDDESLFRSIWEPTGAFRDPFISPHIEALAPLHIRVRSAS